MSLTNRKSCLTLAALCCLAILPICAPAQYRFDHWTAENGLPQNIITALHQTRDGYLWVATLDGLARFDGVRFTTFDKSNSPGVRSNRFTTLFEDRQGDLWLGTESSGLTRFSRGRFTTYGAEHGLPVGNILGLTGDESGGLWVWSNEWIRQWRPADQRFIEISAPRFPNGYHHSAWIDQSGLWGLDRSGLHNFVRGKWRNFVLPVELRDLYDFNVSVSEDGVIWFRNAKRQIFRLREIGRLQDGQTVELGQSTSALSESARAGWTISYRDRQGQSWAINVDRNLWRSLILPSSGRLEQLVFSILFEDREGHLWLGTDGQGLYRVRKQMITTLSQPQGLVQRNVYPVYADRSGAVWIGAWLGGLSRFKDGKFTNFTARDGLVDGPVQAFCEDHQGRLWIGGQKRLQIFQDGRFSFFTHDLLPDRDAISVLYQDRAGTMWIGAETKGLASYRDGKAARYTTQNGLASNNVKVIIESAGGGLWIGCYGGLSRLADNRLTTWTEGDGLPSNMIRALYEDRDGALWIGAYDGGLGRFKDGKFTRYTTRDGLFNNGAFQILEDSVGHLWMSSNHGIYRVRKRELNDFAEGKINAVTSIAYGQSDGMLNVECNGGLWPSGAKTQDGKLWFPTQDGVAVVDPAIITTNPQPPPVVIEDVRIDNQSVPLEAKESALRTQPHERSAIQIRPDQENLEIQYTAPSLINSERIKFKYRLTGLDHEWVDVGVRRTAYYPHIPPGSYVFKVIAANSDGVWNMTGQSLQITVLPPFYRTWWFLTLAALAVSGVVMGVFKYRVSQLEQRQAAQQSFARQLIESQEAERKRIASELHDSLGQSLILIRNWSLMGASQLEAQSPAREEFDEITATASRAINEVRTIAYNLGPYHLDRLGLAETIRDMINRVAQASGVAFTTDLETLDRSLSREAEINLYRIAQEAINNLVKHSGATEATVALKQTAAGVKLIVSDNGHGFDAAATLSGARQRGFGLHGLEERVRFLRGAWSLHSAPGSGTRLEVTLPFSERSA